MTSTNVWTGLAVVVTLAVARAVAANVTVSLVSDRQPGAGAAHGLKQIAAALRDKKVAIQRAATVGAAKANHHFAVEHLRRILGEDGEK